MFGALITQYRRRMALTQDGLAERTGLGVRTIRDLESGGGRVPRPASVRLLADAFGLTGAERERFLRAAHPAAGPPAEPAPTAVPAELPADVSAFVGRDSELDRLDRLLDGDRRGPVVISALSGTAGVGKTALAVRWAHRAANRFPDGQLYLNLRGYDPEEPMVAGDALARLLGALGVPGSALPLPVEERAARYRTTIAGRRMLVVLDNAATVEQVRPLLPGTGSCVVLVTSRDSLAGLVSVNGAKRLDLDLLSTAEAVALLRRLVGARVDADPAAAATLAGLCDRLPLALRIAAELAVAQPTRPLADLVRDLTDQRRRLDLLDTGDDPRAAVATVFSWSIQHLPAAGARMFRLLGLHPGTDYDAYAAAALAGTDLAGAEHTLRTLVRAHLVQPAERGRYRMHDLLRAYASDQAAATDPDQDRRAALTRLFDHYLATAATAMDVLVPVDVHRRPRIAPPGTPAPDLVDPDTARAWLDTELATIVAVAGHTSAHGWPTHTTRLSTTLLRYLFGGLPNEALAIHRAAVAAARSTGDLVGQADAQTNVGIAYYQMGQHETAAGQFEQALGWYREADSPGRARALQNLGVVEERLGRYQSAAARHHEARALCRAAGDRANEARALISLGVISTRLQDFEGAAAHYEAALEFFDVTGDVLGRAGALNHLGSIEAKLGRFAAATEHLEEALAVVQRFGDPNQEAWTLDSLGALYIRLGQPERGGEQYEQALEIFREIGDRDGEVWAFNGLGDAALAAGRPAEAVARHTAAHALAIVISARSEQARAETGLGDAHRDLGDVAAARGHYERALAIHTELGTPAVDVIRARLAELAEPPQASA